MLSKNESLKVQVVAAHVWTHVVELFKLYNYFCSSGSPSNTAESGSGRSLIDVRHWQLQILAVCYIFVLYSGHQMKYLEQTRWEISIIKLRGYESVCQRGKRS